MQQGGLLSTSESLQGSFGWIMASALSCFFKYSSFHMSDDAHCCKDNSIVA